MKELLTPRELICTCENHGHVVRQKRFHFLFSLLAATSSAPLHLPSCACRPAALISYCSSGRFSPPQVAQPPHQLAPRGWCRSLPPQVSIPTSFGWPCRPRPPGSSAAADWGARTSQSASRPAGTSST
eukprot:scaffold7358_cov252-Pinguiococcus_pyrenoidosus.AAC.37